MLTSLLAKWTDKTHPTKKPFFPPLFHSLILLVSLSHAPISFSILFRLRSTLSENVYTYTRERIKIDDEDRFRNTRNVNQFYFLGHIAASIGGGDFFPWYNSTLLYHLSTWRLTKALHHPENFIKSPLDYPMMLHFLLPHPSTSFSPFSHSNSTEEQLEG